MDRSNEFKFSILPEQLFTVEKVLIDNNIEFHNELGIGTNIRSSKYYIKNSDRTLFDKLCKEHEIILLTDSIPFIEYRFPKINNLSIIILVLLFILVFLILAFTL